MHAKLASTLAYFLVAAAALTALVLSLVAVIKLREARSIEVRNAADCSISQSAGGNARAENRCSGGTAGGSGSLKQVVARARGNARVVAPPDRCDQNGCGSPGPRRSYPLGGGTWTQGARESDQFIGEVTWSGCGEVNIDLWVNGREVGSARVLDEGTRKRATFHLEQTYSYGAAVLFEPVSRVVAD